MLFTQRDSWAIAGSFVASFKNGGSLQQRYLWAHISFLRFAMAWTGGGCGVCANRFADAGLADAGCADLLFYVWLGQTSSA